MGGERQRQVEVALGTRRWVTAEGANDGGQRVKPQKQYRPATTTHCNQCVW